MHCENVHYKLSTVGIVWKAGLLVACLNCFTGKRTGSCCWFIVFQIIILTRGFLCGLRVQARHCRWVPLPAAAVVLAWLRCALESACQGAFSKTQGMSITGYPLSLDVSGCGRGGLQNLRVARLRTGLHKRRSASQLVTRLQFWLVRKLGALKPPSFNTPSHRYHQACFVI